MCHESVVRVIALTGNRLIAEFIASVIGHQFPQALLVRAATIAEFRLSLATAGADLLVCATSVADGDVFDALRFWQQGHRVLVVATTPPLGLLERLWMHQVSGIFDAEAEDAGAFRVALDRVSRGGAYWMDSHVTRLASSAPLARCYRCVLTVREQIVLALIADGSADQAAADRLGLATASVKSVRRDIYRKLGLHDLGDLVRFASKHGVVHLSASGPVPYGLASLEREAQGSRMPRAMSPSHHRAA